MNIEEFVTQFTALSDAIVDNANAHGFHDNPRTFGDECALLHSEVSEAFEGFRHGNPPSEHIPMFTAMEEELADVVIRCCDSSVDGHRLALAIVAKMEFNASRPFKHGGKVL